MSSLYKGPILYVIIPVVALAILAGMSALLTAQTGNGKPDYNVKVIGFYPQGIVENPTNITIKFSGNLVPDDSLNKITANIPLIINPPIEGLGRWIDNNEFRFYPDAMYAPSTLFRVAVESDESYINGNRINDKKTFEFRTPTIAVDNVTTEIIDVPDSRNNNRLLVHIAFNYAVEFSQLIHHVEINLNAEGGRVKFDTKDKEPSKSFTLFSQPFSPRITNGEFEFAITRGLECIGGQIPLQADYRQKVRIDKPQPFVIEQVHSDQSGPNGRITIQFPYSVELNDFDEYLSISPEIKYTIDQRYGYVQLYGNLKPGQVYTINIRKGLTAVNGQYLERDFSTTVQMPDLQPSLRFLDNGYFLSQKSSQLLGIETINIEEITVEVEQVFVNNIAYFLSGDKGRYYGNTYNIGRKIFAKDYILTSAKNEQHESTFDLGEVVGDTLQGIYAVSIRRKDNRWDYAERRVMITDLGIMARISDNFLMVWVNSLSETQPVSGVDVKLISLNNQALVEGRTGKDGVAIFKNIGEALNGFEPFVITAAKDKDLAYLKFSECLLPTSEFDSKGRPFLTKGYEAFIYSDRGVYRPGEAVHLVSVIRGKNNVLPEEFPYKIFISDPQGQDFKEYKMSTNNKGLESFDINIPVFAKTGKYNAVAKIGNDIIGEYSFQVEEFLPDRIKTTLSTDKDSYRAGEQVDITVNGTYLFGTPCDGNKVSGRVLIESEPYQSSKWPGYIFSDDARSFTAVKSELQPEALDRNGDHTYVYSIPESLTPPSALKMLISASVQEEGGRAVSAYKGLPVYPYPIYLGLKENFDGYVEAGENASFSVIALNDQGDFAGPTPVWAKFYRVIYQTIVKKDNNGIYRYVSEEQDQIIDSMLVSFNDQPALANFVPGDYGAYRLTVESARTKHRSSLMFYVSGWGYAPWAMTNPDRLEMELDAKQYQNGQAAKLLIKAPFNGRLLLTIEKDEVLEYHTYDLDSNTAEIKIPVGKNYSPNVYITGTLLKSTTSLERFSPSRAFGLVPLIVSNPDTKLTIAIDAPKEIRPKRDIEIKIKTSPGSQLAIAVADVGILQLTDFQSPDPYQFFYGKRRPSLRAYDIYSFIFPDIKPAQTMLSVGGDALAEFEARRARHMSPISSFRAKPVALWSGIIKADSLGNAVAKFYVPQFNGRLKVMASGYKGQKCGMASGEITVKDNILIQESLPRFVMTGDKVITKVLVFNNSGQDGNIEVSMNIAGSAELVSDKTVPLYIPNGQKASAQFVFDTGYEPGNLAFKIKAAGANYTSEIEVDLPNRPPQPLLTEYGSGIIKIDQPASLDLPSNWLKNTAEYNLKISSIPSLQFSKSIQFLLSYPYGCLEQTTSKVFPMLYYSDVAKFVQPALAGSGGADYFIEEGLLKISGMQLPSGGFAYWPNESDYSPWASIYACHFLVEARKAGYSITENVYNRMLKYLKKTANDASLENNNGTLRIYAAYVLSLAGELDKSTYEGLKFLNIEKLPVYTQFMYGGIIARMSTPEEALWVLPTKIHPLRFEPETGEFFNSSIRANAILLELLSDIAPENPSIPVLLEDISQNLRFDSWYTTQSTAWGLMAIGKYFSTQELPDYSGKIIIDGSVYKSFGVENLKIKNVDLGNKDVEISITGKGACYYYWQASGVSADRTIQEYDNRLRVRREYFTADGDPLDTNSIRLGDQIVAKITAEALDKNLENVIIDDLLPACLEIENPRLATSGKVDWIQGKSFSPAYMDIRDDRLLLFADLRQGRPFTYYYSLRVISSGEYTVPPVASECMYDPTIKSAGSSGSLNVID